MLSGLSTNGSIAGKSTMIIRLVVKIEWVSRREGETTCWRVKNENIVVCEGMYERVSRIGCVVPRNYAV